VVSRMAAIFADRSSGPATAEIPAQPVVRPGLDRHSAWIRLDSMPARYWARRCRALEIRASVRCSTFFASYSRCASTAWTRSRGPER
jgi:hypothetical protein